MPGRRLTYVYRFRTDEKNDYVKEIERNLDEVHDLVRKNGRYYYRAGPLTMVVQLSAGTNGPVRQGVGRGRARQAAQPGGELQGRTAQVGQRVCAGKVHGQHRFRWVF